MRKVRWRERPTKTTQQFGGWEGLGGDASVWFERDPIVGVGGFPEEMYQKRAKKRHQNRGRGEGQRKREQNTKYERIKKKL